MFDGFTSHLVHTAEADIAVRVGGSGPPLLLIHGYPQTHVMWHKIAPDLAKYFTVICVDLRGYGDSSKPPSAMDHSTYSKRAMAGDLVEVMTKLGFPTFMVAGHDRGGRVVHRMLLDHEDRIRRAAVLDIVPTATVFRSVDSAIAKDQYHWFFLIQEGGLPEHMIGLDPDTYLHSRLFQAGVDPASFTPEALSEYRRCFRDPASIHASCEDYRAAASIDLIHDEDDAGRRVGVPLLVLWSARGSNHRFYDVLQTWRDSFPNAVGQTVDCGHFLAEEQPEATLQAIREFFAQAH